MTPLKLVDQDHVSNGHGAEDPQLLILDVENLFSNPNNLRGDLAVSVELVESVRAHGVLQPLIVTETDDHSYLIVAGHRRFAAAVRAGLHEVPAIMRTDLDEVTEQVATMLGENSDRVGLNVVEKARGFQLMLDDGMSVTAVSKRTGHKADAIKKHLPAAAADERVQGLLVDGKVGLDDLAALDEFDDDPELRATLERDLGKPGFRYELQRHQHNRRFAAQSVTQREELESKGIPVSSNSMAPDDPGDGMTWEKLPAGTTPDSATKDGEIAAIVRRNHGNVKDPVEVCLYKKVAASEKVIAQSEEQKAARLLEEELAAATAMRAQWLAARAARATSVTQAAALARQLIMRKLADAPYDWQRITALLGVTIEIDLREVSHVDRIELARTKVQSALSKMLLPQLVTHLFVLEHDDIDQELEQDSAWGPKSGLGWNGADITAWHQQLATWRYPLAPVEQRLVDAATETDAG